ncbi:hypothetical protein [Allokutzneria sp. NRRL B-24872]|uniref:hypothetical protein n=1 Tax=Allokutzneria sp. NRRL B-24872 TaxID=1137961 RepID=UPI000A3B345D|nr:hypothetical protein [Allokutzneria sp. NRRL B-24872]
MSSPNISRDQLVQQFAAALAHKWRAHLAELTPQARAEFEALPPEQRNSALLELVAPQGSEWGSLRQFERKNAILQAERAKLADEEVARSERVAAALAPDELADSAVPAGSDTVVHRAAGSGQEP